MTFIWEQYNFLINLTDLYFVLSSIIQAVKLMKNMI